MAKLGPGRLQGRFADPFEFKSSIFDRVGSIFCLGGWFCKAFLRRKPVKIDQNRPRFKSCRKRSGFAPGRLQGRFADSFDSESSIFDRMGFIFCLGGWFCRAFLRRKTVQIDQNQPRFKSCWKRSGFVPGRLQGRFADSFDSESSIFDRVGSMFCLGADQGRILTVSSNF